MCSPFPCARQDHSGNREYCCSHTLHPAEGSFSASTKQHQDTEEDSLLWEWRSKEHSQKVDFGEIHHFHGIGINLVLMEQRQGRKDPQEKPQHEERHPCLELTFRSEEIKGMWTSQIPEEHEPSRPAELHFITECYHWVLSLSVITAPYHCITFVSQGRTRIRLSLLPARFTPPDPSHLFHTQVPATKPAWWWCQGVERQMEFPS